MCVKRYLTAWFVIRPVDNLLIKAEFRVIKKFVGCKI